MNCSVVKIDDLIPASYNPRKIDDEAFEKLKESLKTLGPIIPVIVNKKNNVIVAGHQRTKAMKAIGMNEVPVFYAEGITPSDEVVFNQLHNYQDTEKDCEGVCTYSGPTGLTQLDYNSFEIKRFNFVLQTEIGRILGRYGNLLTAVVCKNKVIIGTNYIRCCQLMHITPNVYILPDEKYEAANYYLLQQYGHFCYDSLKKETYIQGLAQLYRRSFTEKGKKSQHSRLYEEFILPSQDKIKGKRILDFGAGKMAYIRTLANISDAVAVEFYPQNVESVDISLGNRLIDYFVKSLKENGLFDFVVCDSVLNSVDCKKAEDSVVGCLNTFCKIGGTLFICGRRLDKEALGEQKTTSLGYRRSARFFDENLFSGILREGQWYYQHFHTPEMWRNLMRENGFEILKEKQGHMWQLECRKVRELPKERIVDAVSYEFNLPLPNNKSYNRHNDVLEALKGIYL